MGIVQGGIMKYKVGQWRVGMMVDRFDAICDEDGNVLIFDTLEDAVA